MLQGVVQRVRRHIDGLECGPPRRRGRVYTHRHPCAEAFVCTDTAYGWTVVWPDMCYVLVEAELDKEIHCDDVRGIVFSRRGAGRLAVAHQGADAHRPGPFVQPTDRDGPECPHRGHGQRARYHDRRPAPGRHREPVAPIDRHKPNQEPTRR